MEQKIIIVKYNPCIRIYDYISTKRLEFRKLVDEIKNKYGITYFDDSYYFYEYELPKIEKDEQEKAITILKLSNFYNSAEWMFENKYEKEIEPEYMCYKLIGKINAIIYNSDNEELKNELDKLKSLIYEENEKTLKINK